MRAMILAAGLGTRMRPLSEDVPKPLLPVGGKPLMQHIVEALRRAGVARLVVNHGRLGERIEETFGDGSAYGVEIRYSAEGPAPLETGGGIRRALPLLGPEPFLVVNGDIWTDFDYGSLPPQPEGVAHIVLVPNPPHHPAGDFHLERGRVRENSGARLTYSGIAVFRPELFRDCPEGAFPLAPLLRAAIARGAVSGEFFSGRWFDVGSPERLRDADLAVARRPS